MDEYFIQKISHCFVANSTPEAVFMAVDVKVFYYDLRAVSDLTAAVSTDRFTGPLKEQKSKFLHHGAYLTQTVSCLITGKEVS